MPPYNDEAPPLETVQQDIDRKIRERGRFIKRFFARRLEEPHRAEDLAQETFLRAWMSRPDRLESDDDWIRRCAAIARNLLIDDWRRRRTEKKRVEQYKRSLRNEPDFAAGPLNAMERRELIIETERLVQQLPEKTQQALRLHADGVHFEEIARIVQIKPDAARARVRRAKLFVTERLQQKGFDVP